MQAAWPDNAAEHVGEGWWRFWRWGLRMDLVDGDVDVLVLLVAVPDGDELVLLESGGSDGAFHRALELALFERTVVGVKRDDQMVGLVTLSPGVPALVGFDDLDCRVGVLGSVDAFEVSRHEPGAALGPFPLEHVLQEPAEPRCGRPRALSLCGSWAR